MATDSSAEDNEQSPSSSSDGKVVKMHKSGAPTAIAPLFYHATILVHTAMQLVHHIPIVYLAEFGDI